MNNLWNNVTAQDVLQAIDLFDRRQESYPPARNTFLLYNDREYPAKHMRGLAYKFANKKEISKDDYSGGEELPDQSWVYREIQRKNHPTETSINFVRIYND